MLRSSLVLALVLAACGSDPADVAGTYSLSLTNRANGCALANWTEGPIQGAVTMVVSQSDASVSAEVQGLARAALDAVTGGHIFTGDVDGDDVTAEIVGTRAASQGACAYTMDAELTGTLAGDTLTGHVRYRARTNGADDCGTLTGCVSEQAFAGARAPQ